MRVFQIFCAVLATVFVLITIFTVQPAQAGVREWLCGDGIYRSECEPSDGWTCEDNVVVNPLGQCSGHGGARFQVVPICGDGMIDIGEVCDNGSQNSDTQPNACRNDCRAYYCGDGVVDSGEECDEAYSNEVGSPNHCRNDCTLPVCGDGINDTAYNEECDDGNNNDLDGCKKDCTTCLQLSSNINVTADTSLCRQVFNVDDYGPEGVIIIQHPGVTLDCDGATLQGAGGNVGIYVMQASNVTVKNCTVTGYDVGIKVVDSQNVKYGGLGNNMSGNTKPIELENSQLALPQAQSSADIGGISGQAPKKIDVQPGQTGGKFQTGMKTPGLVKPGVKIPGMAKPGVKTPGLLKPGVSGRSVLPSRQPKPGQPRTLGVQPTGTKAGSVKKMTTSQSEEEEEPLAPAKLTAPTGTSVIKQIKPVAK